MECSDAMEARKMRSASGSTLTPLVIGKTNANLIALTLSFLRYEQAVYLRRLSVYN